MQSTFAKFNQKNMLHEIIGCARLCSDAEVDEIPDRLKEFENKAILFNTPKGRVLGNLCANRNGLRADNLRRPDRFRPPYFIDLWCGSRTWTKHSSWIHIGGGWCPSRTRRAFGQLLAGR